LVLKRAGLEDADALVAATHDDDVNIEAVRIALDAGVLRVVALAADPEHLSRYRDLGVPVISPDSLTARNIEVRLEPRRVASTAFADGKAEAIEFLVTPDSPVRGKALRDLHSETWVVAAILRGSQLIVPHGSTRIESGDRVTVVGTAADFSRIVHTFTSGESRFPLNYGRKVIVGLDGGAGPAGVVSEAMSLVRNSQAEHLIVVHRDPGSVRDDALAAEVGQQLAQVQKHAEGVEVELRAVTTTVDDAVVALAGEESVGVVAVAAPEGGEVMGRLRVVRALRRYGRLDKPVLFCRGRHPYSSLLAPARRTPAGEAAGRAAIDLAVTGGGTLAGISVVPPAFVAGSDALEDARKAAAWLREEAAVQGVQVRRRIRRGNPVRVMEELAGGASLLVLAMPDGPLSAFRPGIVGHLLRRVATSVLLVPVPE
jgi:trk system potassium uptake protein TrkA